MASLQIAVSTEAAADALQRCARGQINMLKHSLQVTTSDAPVMMEAPQWYGDFLEKWSTVSTHAQVWQDSMMPHFRGVPAMVVDFAAVYADAVRSVEPFLDRLDAQPTDQAARASVATTIASLLDGANSNASVLVTLKSEMDAFTSSLAGDRQVLSDALAAGQNTIGADNAEIVAQATRIEELRNELHESEAAVSNSYIAIGVAIPVFVVAVVVTYSTEGVAAYASTALAAGAAATVQASIDKIIANSERIAKLKWELGEAGATLPLLHAQVTALTALDKTLGDLIENIGESSAIMQDIASGWSSLAQQAASLQAALLDADKQLDAGRIAALRQDLQAGLKHWTDVQPLASGLAAIKIVVDPQRWSLDGTPLPN